MYNQPPPPPTQAVGKGVLPPQPVPVHAVLGLRKNMIELTHVGYVSCMTPFSIIKGALKRKPLRSSKTLEGRAR